ncbi:MAG: preQ(1) synthase [Candidatus Omnitrophota bacterium]
MTEQSSYEGLQQHVRDLKTPEIEVWENQYADREYEVELEIPEFTCICPKTGLPDFAVIRVAYGPADACLELKSLKMYMQFYREVGIFHEHLANKILDDLVQTCDPRWMVIEIVMNPRGGITTTVRREYQRDEKRK